MRAGRAVGLLVFTVHDHQLDVLFVDEVREAGAAEGVEGRVILELAYAAHRDTGQADIGCLLGEAHVAVGTLAGDLLVELLEEGRTAEDERRLATETGELTNFLTKELRDDLLTGCIGELAAIAVHRGSYGADSCTIAPEFVSSHSAVDAADGTRGRVVGDQREQTGDNLSVLGSVFPEHLIEALGPALFHVVELVFEQAGDDGEVTLGMLGGRCTGGAVSY